MDQTAVDRREVLRYMGCKGQQSQAVMELVEDCLAQLGNACEPRHLTAAFPLALSGDGEIDGGCFHTRSKNLARNLADCHSIIVFAATLGTGADHLIHKYSRLEMSRAVVMQAAAAAMIEEYCDQVCSTLKAEYEARGEYLRPRFSPGYGDFPLECQPARLGAREAGK
ncbi:MAG: Vitamin B12 dependent methionine synthase activation subunit, partial [Clostridium sp.]|nr:Vitamin B12 dependent methionine synthase activation subunit [Clostridium sp.]